jgi:hypothetical protein
MASPRANSSISITLRSLAHANVTSKTIVYPNSNPNQKNLVFGPQIPNPNAVEISARKELFTPASVSGLGILDSALCLTQHSIIKELTRGEARSYSNIFLSIISMPHFSFYYSHFRL